MSPARAEATGSPGPRIVVTGATGAVGRQVARLLSTPEGTASPGRPTLFVRDPDKAAALGLSGTVVQGDYQDGGRLREAFDGAEAIFVVTANPLRPQDDENILAAARAAGVRHAVKLSWLGVGDPGADDLVADWNRHAEELLRESGLSWTVLRIRTPMSNALAWAPSIREHGVVRSFGGSARTACVDPRDVAEIAVRALTEPERHSSRTYALTGPQALSGREQTAVLSEVLGRTLRFEEITAEDARAGWSRRYGDRIAEALLEGAQRRAGGAAGHVDGTLEELTGRPPREFAAWATAHAGLFD